MSPDDFYKTYPKNSPLWYCIERFGGVLAYSRAIGRGMNQIYRWRDKGGQITADAQTETLIAAKRLGISIDRARLVYYPEELGT
jgi:hypothetical protein